jgi:hypothetical protein
MWEMLTAHLIQNHETIKRGEDDKFSLASTFMSTKPLFFGSTIVSSTVQHFSVPCFIYYDWQISFIIMKENICICLLFLENYALVPLKGSLVIEILSLTIVH